MKNIINQIRQMNFYSNTYTSIVEVINKKEISKTIYAVYSYKKTDYLFTFEVIQDNKTKDVLDFKIILFYPNKDIRMEDSIKKYFDEKLIINDVFDSYESFVNNTIFIKEDKLKSMKKDIEDVYFQAIIVIMSEFLKENYIHVDLNKDEEKLLLQVI